MREVAYRKQEQESLEAKASVTTERGLGVRPSPPSLLEYRLPPLPPSRDHHRRPGHHVLTDGHIRGVARVHQGRADDLPTRPRCLSGLEAGGRA